MGKTSKNNYTIKEITHQIWEDADKCGNTLIAKGFNKELISEGDLLLLEFEAFPKDANKFYQQYLFGPNGLYTNNI